MTNTIDADTKINNHNASTTHIVSKPEETILKPSNNKQYNQKVIKTHKYTELE